MHPYSNLPDRNFWRKFVSDLPWRDVCLNDQPKFILTKKDRVATAGSCFAQHISRYMTKVGLFPYIAEPAHTLLKEYDGDVVSYNLFTARYGNIYTTRQFLELFRQSVGIIPIVEDFAEHEGRWFDLMRPNVIKAGFSSFIEAQADRIYHLNRVKVMFETANILIFTIGLTESWYHTETGYTYPVCPGTVRGAYDPKIHHFRNLSCAEIIADIEQLIVELKRVNSALRIILTVSPVPLVASYTNKNVLVASMHSKSVLRAAVGEIEARHSHVAYFPSYEIISHPASFGQYLASDLREVTERGVHHVMDCFLSSYYNMGRQSDTIAVNTNESSVATYVVTSSLPECDELMNEVNRN